MALVSVNVSLPREVADGARTVFTGIFKVPVSGRRTLRRLNLEGDGQADLQAHGGPNRAVYVYSLEQYAFWRERLGREDLEAGSFGENFTVDALPDVEVLVGDRFRVGSALVEVSQPRNPCFKLGLRLGDSQMPSLLVAESRPGFYLRVLEEGDVGPGDELELVARDPDSLSVAAINDLYWKPGKDPELLRRAAGLDALSEGWRDGFASFLAPAAPGPGAAPPAWSGFRPFRVRRVVSETAEIRSLQLAPADGRELAPHAAGQAIAVRLAIPGHAAPVLRSYTVSQPPGRDSLRITVKREGLASTFLHGVSAGDILEVGAPRGTFAPDPDSTRPVALISAGVGVTPMVSMLGALLERGGQRPIWFIHGARSRAEHALADEVAGLAADRPDVRVHVAYSRPAPGDTPNSVGRLDAGLITALLDDVDVDVFVCGPAPFAAALLDGLEAWGIPRSQLHEESFGVADVAPAVALAPGTGPNVQFARSALTARFNEVVPSLLQFAEGLGLTPPYGCRTGICQSCAVPVVDGDVEYSLQPLADPPPGQALLCCSTPRTDLVLDL